MTHPSHLHAELPSLDRRKLDELREMDTPGEASIYVTLLEMFFRLTPPLFQELLDALENGDSAAVKRHAHKLAGSCGNYGGMRATRICKDMEEAYDDLNAARAILPSLVEAFMELSGQLQRELDALKPL